MILSVILSSVLLLVPVLVNVAFLTLLERKILGLGQVRKGPNKVSMVGGFQPFADAIKLFVKQIEVPAAGNNIVFSLSPVAMITLVLMVWHVVPLASSPFVGHHSGLLLLVILSLGLYPILLAGWGSNSKYAMVGAVRGVAQTISYEISLALILLSWLFLSGSSETQGWLGDGIAGGGVGVFCPLLILWGVSCLAETNRTPFDFAEGESELVSGFNIEYGGGGFALIFMAEYASILFFSCLSSTMLLGAGKLGAPEVAVTVGVTAVWIWVRATFPRYRYDLLMNLAWKSVLPAAILALFFFLTLSLIN